MRAQDPGIVNQCPFLGVMGKSQGKKAHAVFASYISQDVPIWLR